MAEQYVQAFGNLAKKSNTVILPEKAGDVSSMVAQVSPTIDLTVNRAQAILLTVFGPVTGAGNGHLWSHDQSSQS